MSTCALRSAANDDAWWPAAATSLPVVGGCAAAVRSCNQTLDKTLDAPVSTVSSAFSTCGGKLCRASVGIQNFALQCFFSDRVAVDVSVPLLVPLALFIVGCDSPCQAIHSRWHGSALARLRRVALGRAASTCASKGGSRNITRSGGQRFWPDPV